ncbi:diacylglycerol/lipid kinase family protein [Anaerobaca lacustris]|uniref:Diacylglycerol kinase family lipid kinase n=1 Tax=Anaerobaca lacustris TaxID=3044600 RepID=A0AAW6U539_9BACT|nr:diacylglycerol kinase family lipid kinase [Sedimentisphaerales bacterium M17dextr]
MKPSDGYIKYIVNLKSGASSGKYACRRFCRYLTQHGYNVRVATTTSLEHACELSTDAAVDPGCALVVAAGGDGTVREVAHGLEGSAKPLLIVPCGTENLLANELGFDRWLETLVRTFEGGVTRPLDMGTVNGKCFTSIVGFGFDGDVVGMVHRRRTGHINHFDYVYPLWRTFWGHRFEPIAVAVDGREVFDGPGMVFVGNISRYAIGLQILHHADFSDGLLDVCIYRCAGRIRLVKHSVLTVLKHHANCRDVIYEQGKHITVRSPSGAIRTEMDGDPGPPLPVHIEVLPGAVQCMVPPGAKPAGIRTRIARSFR